MSSRLTSKQIDEIISIPIEHLKSVGAGGFGQTYRAVLGGNAYLRKDIKLKDDFTRWSFQTEVKYLELVCSQPIYMLVPSTPFFYGAKIRGTTGYIIEEILAGMDLDEIIRHRNLTANEAKFIIRSLEFYIHTIFHDQLRILHLDIKPKNIFIRMHKNVIVSVVLLDLGLSRAIDEIAIGAGTRNFMSPLLLQSAQNDKAIRHVPNFNIHALGLTIEYIKDAIGHVQDVYQRPLLPRPWEENLLMSVSNALCAAGVLGEGATIPDLLSIPGASVNRYGTDRNTPLLCAISNKKVEVAKILLDAGADASLRNGRGSTPLHWAASQNLGEILQLLIAKGADINALTLATDPWEPSATPMHWACKAGAVETALDLVFARADKSIKDGRGQTALMLAKQKPGQMRQFIEYVEPKGGRRGTRRRSRRNKYRQ
jgi:serine/threonine protein kinase